MKTTTVNRLKTLIDALAFANVNTLGEFRAMLRQVERPLEADKPRPHDALPPADGATTLPDALGGCKE